jgi:hypothetical protein
MKKLLAAALLVCLLQFCAGGGAAEEIKVFGADNLQHDLFATNRRGQIVLSWQPEQEAVTYIVYRALSHQHPWMELARLNDENLKAAGGGFNDITDLGQTRELCYKVDAINEDEQLVKVYEPLCVPKYEPPTYWATNTRGDLFAENWRGEVVVDWTPADTPDVVYHLYEALSPEGPWTSFFDAIVGSNPVHQGQPNALFRDVCYKIEATDKEGTVIRAYEPICVPKYAESGEIEEP